jgi:thiosulfate reductase cytochrome b subunit
VFFNTFVNPIALEDIAWRYYIVYVVIILAGGGIIYFCYPETNGHSLEEMISVFDKTATLHKETVEHTDGVEHHKVNVKQNV